MSIVFLDTVGMLALWDEADQWHEHADRAHDKFKTSRATDFTTSFVLLKCGNAAARRPYRQAVVKFQDVMLANRGLIVPSEHDWLQAWAAYARNEAGGAGIVDQISFVVMRRMGIRRAFTNDAHFRAAGFETLF